MMRVLLFDIDGTLVHAGGAGRRALERALRAHLGELNGAVTELRLDGMTDRLIVREAMVALGREFEEAACDRILASYVEYLRVEIASPGYRVLPGIGELLPALRRRGALVGLCTGNVEDGARVKLGRGGIDAFFDWGAGAVAGFGGDGEARERIVEAALARAGRRLGRAVRPAEVLVVGDTPRDVEAARRAGVPVLGVATGRYGVEELLACGADRVLPDLGGPEVADLLLAGAA
jgi:phosphoglycolate phosphatase-like HAD superfamily hydrolase